MAAVSEIDTREGVFIRDSFVFTQTEINNDVIHVSGAAVLVTNNSPDVSIDITAEDSGDGVNYSPVGITIHETALAASVTLVPQALTTFLIKSRGEFVRINVNPTVVGERVEDPAFVRLIQFRPVARNLGYGT